MKKSGLSVNIACLLLILFLPSLVYSQRTFNTKKKANTSIGTTKLNPIVVNGSAVKSHKTYQSLNAAITSHTFQISAVNSLPVSTSDKYKKIVLSNTTKLPVFIQSNNENTLTEKKAGDLQTASFSYLNELAHLLKIGNPETLFQITSTTIDKSSKKHVRMSQVYKGIPVYGAEIMVHLDQNNRGEIFNGRFSPISEEINTNAGITALNAIGKAGEGLLTKGKKIAKTSANIMIAEYEKPKANLVIYGNNDNLKDYKLAYEIEIFSSDHHRWKYIVDANNGDILHSYENTCHVDGTKTASANDLNGVNRSFNTYLQGTTYFMLDITRPMYVTSSLPDDAKGALVTLDMKNTFGDNEKFWYVTTSNNVWTNPTAVSAHYNAGVAYEYYRTVHNRNSIDGIGGTIYSVINVADPETGDPMDNAFWSGKLMWYGNGDASFTPLAGGMDVAGHEMTHGVVENTANLEYDGESGAINESMADIFGAMMDDEDWLIGEDVVKTSSFPSGALRSLSNPHNGGASLSDNGYQPMNMSEKYTGDQDNHGVHINSGIPNHAFYLFATAIGKADAADIYYKALKDYLTKSSQFIDLRLAIIQAATDLFGAGSNAVAQAANAFNSVGITDGQATPVVTGIQTNPGPEYILVYNTDVADDNTLYRTDYDFTNPDPLTTTGFYSRPSITDDGTFALFVADDKTINAIYTDPNLLPDEVVIDDSPIWSNVVISKDGGRIAAVTDYEDTTIYVIDLATESIAAFQLYNPSYVQGVKTAGPVYADALDFDHSGEYLVYDAFNRLEKDNGNDIEYWDVNFIHVWDNNSNDFADGTVSKLFSSLPEDVSIGNPSFSKNSPSIIAFDYFNFAQDEYAILGCNIETNDLNTITENTSLGWPSYNKDDSRIVFTSYDDVDGDEIQYIDLNADKITSSSTASLQFTGAKWPVYFAVGVRNLEPTSIDNKDIGNLDLKTYPNPFTDALTIEINNDNLQTSTIEIINQTGQVVFHSDFIPELGNAMKIDLSQLNAGYYIIKVSNNNSLNIGKVIKLSH